MSKLLDMDGHQSPNASGAPSSYIGPDQDIAPRPYPRRAPGDSILRGRRLLVIDSDVPRGRRVCDTLGQRAAASRHHRGDGVTTRDGSVEHTRRGRVWWR